MEDCIFCKIAAGEIPAKVVYEDEEVVAFHDMNPEAPTHILVIPKKHISSLAEATDGDQQVLGKLLLTVKDIAAEIFPPDTGYRTVINTGAEAGQSVYHIHAHLLGGRNMQWPPG